MEAGNWRKGLDLKLLLTENPEQFDFFQAVKIIEQLEDRLAAPHSGSGTRVKNIKFSSAVSQVFPATNIKDIKLSNGEGRPAEIEVNFMGLAGAHGPLPQPLSQVVIDETRSKNKAAAAFLDIFNHRLIQLFYESKARVSASLATVIGDKHPLGENILATAGLAGIDRNDKLGIPKLGLMRFCGLLAMRPLSRQAIEKLISGLFNVPVKVNEFIGRWLRIDVEQQTRIGGNGQNNILGSSAVVGRRVWDQSGGMEIEIGPLPQKFFPEFLKNGEQFNSLKEVVDLCVDSSISVRIRLVAERNTRHKAKLARDGNIRLGWSSWLLATEQTPEDRQVTVLLRA